MLFFRKKIKPSGFTLIEILIYTAIFGVVAAGIIGVAWNITRLHTTQIASNEIDENLRYVMNLVNSKVRESTMIEQASGTTLILRMPDSTKSPTTFSLSNGTLYIQEGSADPVAITSNRVEVTSLNFEYLSVAGSKGGVRINITMAYKEQPGIASREYLTTVTKVNAITFDSDILPDVNNLRNVGAPNYRWKEGYFSGDVTVQGNVSSSGFIMGGAGLCMGSDCRTSWGQVTGVTGSGTQNYIPKWTSSGAIGNSQIFDNGTNVGIGTTSPGYKLQVAGDIGLGATNSIYFSSKERISANGLGEIGIDYNSGSTATNNFVVYNGSTTALFTVQRAGNVGIGTASPPSLLSVGASSQFQVNSSGDIVKIKNLTYSWPSSHAVGFLKNDGSGNLTWDTSGAVGGSGSAGQVAFWNASTTITGDNGLYWDNVNKRLGIGTTAPGQKLSVVGDIGLSGADRFIGTTDNYALSLKTNNTTRIQITADGNVGIGTTSPSRTLDVAGTAQLRGAAGGLGLSVDSGGNVGIGTASPAALLDVGGGKLAVTSAGNVGIGTTAPEANLHIGAWTEKGLITLGGGKGYAAIGSVRSSGALMLGENVYARYLDSSDNRVVRIGGNSSTGFSLATFEPNGVIKFFGKSGSVTADDIANTDSNLKMIINSSGNVGIGTTSPGAKLHIANNGLNELRIEAADNTYSFYRPDITLFRARGSLDSKAIVTSNDWLGVIRWFGYDGSAYQPAGFIKGIVDGTPGASDMPGRIEFGTTPDGSNVEQIRMVIKNDGNVGIGTTSPGYKLDVSGILRAEAVVSTNRNVIGLEYNILFNAPIRYNVSQTGPHTLNLPMLFDGSWSPSYSPTGPSIDNPQIILIEGLPEVHTQAGAWVGWSTRYWPPKKFKIEGYDTYAGYNNWRTIADYSATDYSGSDFIIKIPIGGQYTKLRYTVYEGTGTDGRFGFSELFFIHPEVGRPYIGFLPSSMYEGLSGNVGIGTTAPAAKLDVNGEIYYKGSFIQNYQYTQSYSGDTWIKLFTTNNWGGKAKIQLSVQGNNLGTHGEIDIQIGMANNSGANVISKISQYSLGLMELQITTATTTWSSPASVYIKCKDGGTGGTLYWSVMDAYNVTINNTQESPTGNVIFDQVYTATDSIASLGTGVYVNKTGNVGIGTTNPGKKLDVYGGEIRVTSDDTTGALVINRVSNPDQALYLRGGAGSGEGRVASQYSLELKAGLGGGGAFNLTLSTAAGEAMRILGSNNNIGIGTANPGYKLEVAGSFKSSSGGGNLIQDTSGNVIIEL